jgi:hypothetical protein
MSCHQRRLQLAQVLLGEGAHLEDGAHHLLDRGLIGATKLLTSQPVPFHSQVRPSNVYSSFSDGEAGKSISAMT